VTDEQQQPTFLVPVELTLEAESAEDAVELAWKQLVDAGIDVQSAGPAHERIEL
jgi:hypothetical protein